MHCGRTGRWHLAGSRCLLPPSPLRHCVMLLSVRRCVSAEGGGGVSLLHIWEDVGSLPTNQDAARVTLFSCGCLPTSGSRDETCQVAMPEVLRRQSPTLTIIECVFPCKPQVGRNLIKPHGKTPGNRTQPGHCNVQLWMFGVPALSMCQIFQIGMPDSGLRTGQQLFPGCL